MKCWLNKKRSISLTGRIIKSYIESEIALINLSATIFVPLDAKTCADFSTEATTTFTFARLRMSIKVTTSISSDPLAIGMRTYKIYQGNCSNFFIVFTIMPQDKELIGVRTLLLNLIL